MGLKEIELILDSIESTIKDAEAFLETLQALSNNGYEKHTLDWANFFTQSKLVNAALNQFALDNIMHQFNSQKFASMMTAEYQPLNVDKE